jgi:hypothetical protein
MYSYINDTKPSNQPSRPLPLAPLVGASSMPGLSSQARTTVGQSGPSAEPGYDEQLAIGVFIWEGRPARDGYV